MLWAPASVVVRHRLLSTTVVTFFSSGLVASPCHQQSKCSMFLSVRFKKRGSGTNPSRCHCTALRRRCRLPFHRCAICRSNSDRWHLPLSLAASRQAATAFILAGSSKQPSMAGPQTPKDRVVRFATAAIGRMDGRRLLWKGSQLASSAFLEL
jgi:hypothetical protein